MAKKLSSHFNISPDLFRKVGIFDAVMGVDSHLFVDPLLLKNTKISEFVNSRNKLENYFSELIKLLTAYELNKGEVIWRAINKRLTFKELKGVYIGYGIGEDNGNAIGPKLGVRLSVTALEIVKSGVKDPAIFELLGLFEPDVGADRISDMTISILKEDFFRFTERVTKDLSISNTINIKIADTTYVLPRNPLKKDKPIIFLPMELLRNLPVAHSWEDIGIVASHNEELRRKLNEIVGVVWKKNAQIPKSALKQFVLSNPKQLESLLMAYKNYDSKPYDFEKDPQGKLSWLDSGKLVAKENPIKLEFNKAGGTTEIKRVVEGIILQFKKNVENNGANRFLFEKKGHRYKAKNERYSQLLFYAIADSYCEANDIDLSREPNAGNGPVDFKLSSGYKNKVLVEIKLSSNPNLAKGLKKQIPAYEESEKTKTSFYVVIKVTDSKKNIENLLKLKDDLSAKNEVPAIIIIDAMIKPSASNLR